MVKIIMKNDFKKRMAKLQVGLDTHCLGITGNLMNLIMGKNFLINMIGDTILKFASCIKSITKLISDSIGCSLPEWQ